MSGFNSGPPDPATNPVGVGGQGSGAPDIANMTTIRMVRKPPAAQAVDGGEQAPVNLAAMPGAAASGAEANIEAPPKEQIEAALNALEQASTDEELGQVLEKWPLVLVHLETLLALVERVAEADEGRARQRLAQQLQWLLVVRERGLAAAQQWRAAHRQEAASDQMALLMERLEHLPEAQQRELVALLEAAQVPNLQPAERARREEAVMAAMARILGGAGNPAQAQVPIFTDPTEAVQAFLQAETWSISFDILAANERLLLRPEITALFEQLIQQARAAGEEQAVRVFQQHAKILAQARAIGTAAARAEFFATASPPTPESTALDSTPDAEEPEPAIAPPTPAIAAPNIAAVEALLRRPGAVDPDTARALRAWLGEGDDIATAEEIQAALRAIAPQLGGA